ncbi:hypothetical protein cypCar_00000498 [Cyprinus carpio]|nr:hypothetical protein cypCar_00000498 [Cyprinus carpio]
MTVKFNSTIIAHINTSRSFSNIPPFPPLAVFIAAHPSRSHRPCPGFAVLVLGPIVVERGDVICMFVLAGKMDQVDARCCCDRCRDGVFAFKDLKMNSVMNQ